MYLNGRQPGVKLLDRVRNALRAGQYALETEKTYVDWIKKYIHFHGKRHPEEMGALEVEQFLTHLAVERKVAKDTQRQALNALVFLYRTVLDRELGKVMPIRGRQGKRLPVVLTRREEPHVPLRFQTLRSLDDLVEAHDKNNRTIFATGFVFFETRTTVQKANGLHIGKAQRRRFAIADRCERSPRSREQDRSSNQAFSGTRGLSTNDRDDRAAPEGWTT